MSESREIAAGRPCNYDESMCNKALLLFNDGLSQVEVATELGITYDSYLLYQKQYPEFRESVKIGLQLAEAWWHKKGREGLDKKSFNYVGWSMQVKNRFRYHTDEQPVKLPALKDAKTFTDRINVILDAVQNGKITPSEAKRLSETVAIGAKVEEVTELKKIIEELESKE